MGLYKWLVDSARIVAGAVTEAKIGTGAVTADKIGTGAVTAGKIGTNAVTTVKITALNVTRAKLATITRELFIPGFGDNMMRQGHFWTQELSNGAVDYMDGNFKVPDDYVSGGSVVPVIIANGASGNVVSTLEIEYAASDESYSGNNSSYTSNVVTVSIFDIMALTSLNAAAGLALGDFVGIKYSRIGNSGSDTLEAACQGVGFVFTYQGKA